MDVGCTCVSVYVMCMSCVCEVYATVIGGLQHLLVLDLCSFVKWTQPHIICTLLVVSNGTNFAQLESCTTTNRIVVCFENKIIDNNIYIYLSVV